MSSCQKCKCFLKWHSYGILLSEDPFHSWGRYVRRLKVWAWAPWKCCEWRYYCLAKTNETLVKVSNTWSYWTLTCTQVGVFFFSSLHSFSFFLFFFWIVFQSLNCFGLWTTEIITINKGIKLTCRKSSFKIKDWIHRLAFTRAGRHMKWTVHMNLFWVKQKSKETQQNMLLELKCHLKGQSLNKYKMRGNPQG